MATLQRTPQDDIRPTVYEHLKAIVTEITLTHATGTKFFAEQITSSVNAGAPTGVACTSVFGGTIHVTQVQVSWVDHTSGTLKHRVYFRVVGESTWLLDTPSGVDAGTTTHVVKALDPTRVYEFMVTSWNQATGTESDQSNIATCFTTLRNTFIYQINETVLAA